jgi:hypothetical protein
MFGLTDNVLVSVLNAVFNQDAAAPISTAAYNLCSTRSLRSHRFGAQWLVGVLHIVTDWKLWALDANEVFILACATLEQYPVNGWIPLILVALNKVPSEDKVLSNVVDTVAYHAHSNIMPRHSTILGFAEFIRLPLAYTLEIHYPVIIELLPWKDLHPEV